MASINKGLAYFDASYSLKQFSVSSEHSNSASTPIYTNDVQFSTPVFIGMKPKKSFQLVLVTIPNEGIYLYEASEQQPLRSWVLPENLKVEGPALIKINSPLNTNKNKKLNGLTANGKGSDSGIETDISSLIDTKVFQLLDNGFTMYCKVREHDGIKKVAVWDSKDKRNVVKFEHEIQAIHIINAVGDAGQQIGGDLFVLFVGGKAQFYNEKSKTMAEPIRIFEEEIRYSFGFNIASSALEKSLFSNFNSHGFAILVFSKTQTGHKVFLLQVQNLPTMTGPKGTSLIKAIPVGFLGQDLDSLNTVFKFDYHPQSNTLALIDKNYCLRAYKFTIIAVKSETKMRLEELKSFKINKAICQDILPDIVILSRDYLAVATTQFDTAKDVLETSISLLDIKLNTVVSRSKINSCEAQHYTKKNSYLHRVTKFSDLNLLLTGLSYLNKGVKSNRMFDLVLTPIQCPSTSNLLTTFNKAELTNYLIGSSDNSNAKKLRKGRETKSKLYEELLQNLESNLTLESLTGTELVALVLKHIKSMHFETMKLDQVKDKFLETAFEKVSAFTHEKTASNKKTKAEESCYKLHDRWFKANFKQEAARWSELDNLVILPNTYLEQLVKHLLGINSENSSTLSKYNSHLMTLLIATRQINSTILRNLGYQTGLLPTLLQFGDWANVPLALHLTHDISELEVVALIQKVLTISPKVKKAPLKLSEDSKTNCVRFLQLVIEANFDMKLLGKYLPQLDVVRTRQLLELCTELLDLSPEFARIHTHIRPHIQKVAALVTALLDSNYQIFVTAPQLTETLILFQQRLDHKLHLLQAVDEVVPSLQSLVEKVEHPFELKLDIISKAKKRRLDKNNYTQNTEKAYKVTYFDL